MKTQHTPEPWIIDECEDVYGNDTVRQADGSPNGATDTQPIATVYAPHAAERIVACVNACKGINPEAVPDLLAHLQGIVVAADDPDNEDPRDLVRAIEWESIRAAINKATTP